MGGKQYHHVLGGIFSENKAKYESNIEDERKLFYVALTRAEQNLFISYTLENQPVSEFISNAAESSALQINREDLHYQPPGAVRTFCGGRKPLTEEERRQREEEKARKQGEKEAYRQLVAYAREELYTYYSVGNHFARGIIMEFKDICKEGPEAILQKAREMGMI